MPGRAKGGPPHPGEDKGAAPLAQRAVTKSCKTARNYAATLAASQRSVQCSPALADTYNAPPGAGCPVEQGARQQEAANPRKCDGMLHACMYVLCIVFPEDRDSGDAKASAHRGAA